MKKESNSVREKRSQIEKSTFLKVGILVAGVLISSSAYCSDGSTEVQEIEKMTTSVMNTIFSPWVKKTALVFGGGAGLFQAYAAGSIKPLLLWGGLGLAVNYVPKLVDVIGNL